MSSGLECADLSSTRTAVDKFFIKRYLTIVGVVILFVVLSLISGYVTGFDVVTALMDFPAGFAWFVQNFMPSERSLGYLDTILPALLTTFLNSVAAGTTAAVLAYICAVLGSRSVGLGGPVPFIVRAIASIFRNIPIVAWAFLLLFSFKQSEFTGYLALFLQSFGFLTRCFLENIDEIGMGPIEALRATGATYFQIIIQAVIPLTITQVVSWVLYMIETNIRDATLVGMLTGTGIGFVFDMYYKSMRYDISGLVLLCVVIVVIICETSSNFIRRRVK
jgi:phosphonate transport system permease protein